MMDLDCIEDRDVKERLAQWLEAVREAAAAGLNEEEAIRRARQLEAAILAGSLSPEDVELDEEFKDVLYALVYRVLPEQGASTEERERRIAAVSEFIGRIPWAEDDLDEKQDLLKDWAEVAGVPGCSRAVGARQANAQTEEGSGEEEFQRAFDSALPLIHKLLVEQHRLEEQQARGLEKDLRTWFVRFCRRTIAPPRNPRAVLVTAGSRLARHRGLGTGELDESSDARIKRLFERASSGGWPGASKAGKAPPRSH